MSLALFLAGLLLIALLTAAAAAVRSVSRIWLRHWVEERLGGGGNASLSVDGVQRLLLAASTAVALVAFFNGAVIGTRWVADTQALLERIALAAVLMLVVGQLVPRAIGRRWATTLVPAFVSGLRVVAGVLAPLVAMAEALVRERAAPSGSAAAPAEEGRGALADLLREGELEGVGDAVESAIISGVVDFSEKRAHDVMTPRSEIFHLEKRMPARALVAQVAQAGFSRVPITDGGLDHVVGMLHAFDVLKWEEGAPPPLRRAVVVRDDAVASELLSRMLRERVHLAIIQDSAAHTVGLVTMEDLLEELVGDIRDEHDVLKP